MLFYIDRTVAEELGKRELSKQEQAFFADLASACRQGKCFLSGDVESLSLLAKHLESLSGNIYLYAKGKRAEHGALMQAVSTVFVLTFAEDPSLDSLPSVLKSDGKCSFLSISRSISNGWQLNNECCLLAENLTDSKFYKLLAEHYCASQNIRGVRLAFHRELGAGDTIRDVLHKCVAEEKMPTLCIVDSDQKHGRTREYPNEPGKGGTLRHVADMAQELEKDSSLPPFFLYSLPVHEVENLIPMQILTELAKKSPEMTKGLEMLRKLGKIDGGEPLLYYDLKLGFPFMKTKPQRAYWLEKMLRLGGTEEDMPPETKEAGKIQTYMFFPPVGNNRLLERSLELLTTQEICVDEPLAELWGHIGVMMLTWGCANMPQSA